MQGSEGIFNAPKLYLPETVLLRLSINTENLISKHGSSIPLLLTAGKLGNIDARQALHYFDQHSHSEKG